ncbi:MAG: O-antigen ligase family protein [Bacteroidales bacterium]|jgi:O-antigen ligase
MIFGKIYKEKINSIDIKVFLMQLFAFCLSVFPKFLPYILAFIFVFSINDLKRDFNFHKVFKNKIAFLGIIFYLLYVIGITLSHNLSYGLFDLQIKIPILLFPILCFINIKDYYDCMLKIIKWFILGCFIAVIFCLFYALYQYLHEQYNISHHLWNNNYGINFFLSSRFSVFIHHSYFSMYLNLALLILLFKIWYNEKIFNKKFSFLLVFVFILSIVLLSSKAGLITLFIQCLLFFILYFILNKMYLQGLSIILFFIILLFLLTRIAPEFSNTINNAFKAMDSKNIDKKTIESSAARVLIWESSIKIIKENFLFGVGTGDVKDALINEFKIDGATGALYEKLNAHNQFLQTFIALGFWGFIILLTMFVLPFYLCIKYKKYIYLSFLIICFINFLFESMLEVQTGVMFFAFFNILFSIEQYKEKEIENNI